MKRRKRKKRKKDAQFSDKAGLTPGTPVFIGERKQKEMRVDIMRYGREFVSEIQDADTEECLASRGGSGVAWVNVFGIHDVDAVTGIGELFGLHALTIEDIVNTAQRPKAEEFEDYIFVVLKMMVYNKSRKEIDIETVSLVLGRGFVLSFQEKEGDVFDKVRDRIRHSRGRIRCLGADYLAYSLMDGVVDGYFVALEQVGDHIETVEDEIVLRPVDAHMKEIHRLKREILFLRKSVWPLREEIASILQTDSDLVHEDTRIYLRDLYDHTIRVADMVETCRDILNGMHDIYLSSVSIRMNEVMKVLTVIATMFIPLTFIAGVYGMNFDYMPELHWRWGYPVVMTGMILACIGMLIYFRRKNWL